MGRYIERQLALDQANAMLKLYNLKLIKVKGMYYVVRPETENLRNSKTASMPITHKHLALIAPDEPRRTLTAKLAHVLKHSDKYDKQLRLYDLAIWGLEQTKHVTN
jgi:hypothetical protein